MLIEAEAMLIALLADIAGLTKVQATVMLSSDSAERFAESGRSKSGIALTHKPESLPKNIRVLRSELSPSTLSKILSAESPDTTFDAVLLIAPEGDGVLTSLLKTVQTADCSSVRSFNLDWQLAEIFADKQKTEVWLRHLGISTIPTRTINDATAEAFRFAAQRDHVQNESPFAVLKPRDGAGADSIRIVPLDQDFATIPQQCSDDDRWLLQPLMPGLACSVGFIGGGPHGSTTVLPPARQQILATEGQLSYHGGQVPCESAITDRIAPVAKQLITAIGPFSGYVGVDLLIDLSAPANSPASVRVVEVNPRLCTSYVGYRALAADNLAEWLFQQTPGRPIRWTSNTVTFSASGDITLLVPTCSRAPAVELAAPEAPAS